MNSNISLMSRENLENEFLKITQKNEIPTSNININWENEINECNEKKKRPYHKKPKKRHILENYYCTYHNINISSRIIIQTYILYETCNDWINKEVIKKILNSYNIDLHNIKFILRNFQLYNFENLTNFQIAAMCLIIFQLNNDFENELINDIINILKKFEVII